VQGIPCLCCTKVALLGVCTKRFSAAQGTCQMFPPRILAGLWSWGFVPEFPAKATRSRFLLAQQLLFAGHHILSFVDGAAVHLCITVLSDLQ